MDQNELEAQLVARERDRRDALVNDDMVALSDLLADDLVHVHTTGIVHGKEQLLDHAGRVLRFAEVERGPLTIRQVGPDAAIMTGPMTNLVGRRGEAESIKVQAFVTQIWVRREGAWRIASFHATRPTDQN